MCIQTFLTLMHNIGTRSPYFYKSFYIWLYGHLRVILTEKWFIFKMVVQWCTTPAQMFSVFLPVDVVVGGNGQPMYILRVSYNW